MFRDNETRWSSGTIQPLHLRSECLMIRDAHEGNAAATPTDF